MYPKVQDSNKFIHEQKNYQRATQPPIQYSRVIQNSYPVQSQAGNQSYRNRSGGLAQLEVSRTLSNNHANNYHQRETYQHPQVIRSSFNQQSINFESNDDFLSILNGPEDQEDEQDQQSPLKTNDYKVVSMRELLPHKYQQEEKPKEELETARNRTNSSNKRNDYARKMNSTIIEKSTKQEKEVSGFDNYKNHFLNLIGENGTDSKIDGGEPKVLSPLEQAEAKQMLLIKVIAGLGAFILLLLLFR